MKARQARRPPCLPSRISRRWRSSRPPRLRGAVAVSYATTVHKAQGSELDQAALILPERDLPLLSRELVYTAVTRARRSIVVVGRRALLEQAAGRPLERSSGLAPRLAARGAFGAIEASARSTNGNRPRLSGLLRGNGARSRGRPNCPACAAQQSAPALAHAHARATAASGPADISSGGERHGWCRRNVYPSHNTPTPKDGEQRPLRSRAAILALPRGDASFPRRDCRAGGHRDLRPRTADFLHPDDLSRHRRPDLLSNRRRASRRGASVFVSTPSAATAKDAPILSGVAFVELKEHDGPDAPQDPPGRLARRDRAAARQSEGWPFVEHDRRAGRAGPRAGASHDGPAPRDLVPAPLSDGGGTPRPHHPRRESDLLPAPTDRRLGVAGGAPRAGRDRGVSGPGPGGQTLRRHAVLAGAGAGVSAAGGELLQVPNGDDGAGHAGDREGRRAGDGRAGRRPLRRRRNSRSVLSLLREVGTMFVVFEGIDGSGKTTISESRRQGAARRAASRSSTCARRGRLPPR